MKRRVFLILMLVAVGWIAREFLLPDPILPSPLRVVTPDQAGLVWQECELPIPALASNSPRSDESDACFGRPAPTLVADNRDNAVQFIDKTHLRMTVGQDVYEARADELMAVTVYTLLKNGSPIRSLIALGDTLWLRMFLSNVDGHIAWEIANENPATVIYDGKDLRRVYGLDQVHAAYGLAGKLIFVGEKEGKYFIVYDGQRVSPDYDQITIGYCCETILYTARGGQGRYQFRGTRGGKNYIVEIAAAQLAAQATLVPEKILTSVEASPGPAPSAVPGALTPTPTLSGMELNAETFPSPDGQWMARVTTALPIAGGVSTGDDYYARLEVARTDGTRTWTVVDAWSPFGLGYTIPRPFRWSQDGRYSYFTNVLARDGCAVFVNGSDLQRLDLASGAVLEIIPAGAWWISISPDEDLLVSIRRGAQALQITRHELRTAAEQSTELMVRGEGLQAGDIVWSPDGTAFMLTVAIRPCVGKWADATSVIRFDATSLTQTLLIDADKRLFTTVEWSAANRVLLRDGDNQRWWLDAATGQVTKE